MKEAEKAIVLISKASQALEEAKTIQEIHHLVGMAVAAQAYAKQVRVSKNVIDQATELRIRAERRLGEMLAATPRKKNKPGPGRGKKGESAKEKPVPDGNGLLEDEQESPPSLEDLGITRKESMRAQKFASMAGDKFEEVLAKAKGDGDFSVSSVVKAARQEERRERRQDGIDFFPTPSYCVHRFLEEADLPCGGRWLEPSVGDGSIIRAVNEVRDNIEWTSVDIRPECETDKYGEFIVGDFLEQGLTGFDVVIANPPYSKALEFVVEALKAAKFVAMLLRLNWLGSADRCEFLRENTPDVYVLPDRPSFDNEGTDATEYAWLVWGLNDGKGRLKILKTTPLKDRKKEKGVKES